LKGVLKQNQLEEEREGKAAKKDRRPLESRVDVPSGIKRGEKATQ
jgi:hypothetical protein